MENADENKPYFKCRVALLDKIKQFPFVDWQGWHIDSLTCEKRFKLFVYTQNDQYSQVAVWTPKTGHNP
jgi:hypothetical protein